MRVSDVMTQGVEWVKPGDTIEFVAQRMRDADVGAMPVCQDGRAIGLVTDRDITVRATAHGLDPAHATVVRVMTPAVLTVSPDQDVRDAAETMAGFQVRRVVVADADLRPVGMVTLADLATGGGEVPVASTLRAISAN